MKFSKILIGGALALLALGACNNDEPNEPSTEKSEADYAAEAVISSNDANFTASDQGGSIYFKTEGGEVVLTVDCGVDWYVENNADDLFGTEANLNAGTLTVTAEQNTVEEEQTGTLIFYTAQSRIKFGTIDIVQGAYGAPEITAEVNEWRAAAASEDAITTEIAVEASADWTAAVGDECEWLLAVKNEAGDGVVLTAEASDVTEERTAKVTLSCTDGIRTTYEFINVYQDAKAYVNLSSTTVTFDTEAGSSSVGVEANYDWDFSYDESNGWATVSLGADGDVLVVSVVDYDEETERQIVVTVTAGDGAANVAEAQLTITQAGSKALVLVYTTTSANTKVQLPLAGTIDCTVDWGDGSDVESVTSKMPSHTYATAGEYIVKIDGTVTALNNYNIAWDSDEDELAPVTLLTAVKQWGQTGLTDMEYALCYNTKLTSIPTDVNGSFAEVTNFSEAFEKTGISVIPEGIFDHATKCTDFSYVFRSSSNITTVPSGLFDNCSAATSLSYALASTGITTIPEGIFDNCTSVTNLSGIFSGTPITTIPANIFSKCTEVTNFSSVFYQSSLASIPDGLFDNCTKVTTFLQAFGYTKISSIPDGLFKNCPEVTSFVNTFMYCGSLTEIPKDIFANSSKVTGFGQCFNGTGITSIPDGLFEACTSAKDLQSVFRNCTKLESIPADVFSCLKNAPLATYAFSNAFRGCTKLETIPATLFSGLDAITSLYYAFEDCTGLKTIPADLLRNAPTVTDVQEIFMGCTGLEEIPDGLFSGTNIKGANYAFRNCTSLKTIPKHLICNNTNVTGVNYMFGGCTSLTEVPDSLFAGCSSISNLCHIFHGCTNLTTIPANIFKGCTSAKYIEYTFNGCTNVTEIPIGLFDDCTSVTEVDYCFQNCTSLTQIPTGLFDNNKLITNFKYCFDGCTGIISCESPYTEINGEHVHLYERSDYPSYFTSSTISGTYCFRNCNGLTDYISIPTTWR